MVRAREKLLDPESNVALLWSSSLASPPTFRLPHDPLFCWRASAGQPERIAKARPPCLPSTTASSDVSGPGILPSYMQDPALQCPCIYSTYGQTTGRDTRFFFGSARSVRYILLSKSMPEAASLSTPKHQSKLRDRPAHRRDQRSVGGERRRESPETALRIRSATIAPLRRTGRGL